MHPGAIGGIIGSIAGLAGGHNWNLFQYQEDKRSPRAGVHDQGEPNRVDLCACVLWPDVCTAELLPVFSVDSLRNPVALGYRHGKPKATEDQTRRIAEQIHAGDAKWRA